MGNLFFWFKFSVELHLYTPLKTSFLMSFPSFLVFCHMYTVTVLDAHIKYGKSFTSIDQHMLNREELKKQS